MTITVNIRSSKITLPIYNISYSVRGVSKIATDDEIRGWFVKSDAYSTYKTSGAILVCSQYIDSQYINVTYRMIILKPWRNDNRRLQYMEMGLYNDDLLPEIQMEQQQRGGGEGGGGGGGGGGEGGGEGQNMRKVNRLMQRQTRRQIVRTQYLNEATVMVPGNSQLITILNTTQYDEIEGVIRFKIAFRENCRRLFSNYLASSQETTDLLRVHGRIDISKPEFRAFDLNPIWTEDRRNKQNLRSGHGRLQTVSPILFPEGLHFPQGPEVGSRPEGRVAKARSGPEPNLGDMGKVSCVCSMLLSFNEPKKCVADMILVLGLLYDGFCLLFSQERYRSAYSKAIFIYQDNQGPTLLHRLTGERPPDKTFDLLYVCRRYDEQVK